MSNKHEFDSSEHRFLRNVIVLFRGQDVSGELKELWLRGIKKATERISSI